MKRLKTLLSPLSGLDRARVLALSGLLAGLLISALVSSGKGRLERVDEAFYRFWLTQRNTGVTAADLPRQLVVACIDQATVDTYGWPIPRDMYQDIARRLELAGAKTVALDILFPDSKPIDPKGQRQWNSDSPAMAACLARSEVVVACELKVEPEGLVQLLPEASLISSWTPEDRRRRAGFTAVPGEPNEVRGVWLRIEQGNQTLYAWPVVVLAHFLDKSPQEVLASLPPWQLQTYPTTARTDDQVTDVVATQAFVNIPGQGLDKEGHPLADAQHQLSSLLNPISVKQLMDIPEDALPGCFGDIRGGFIAIVGNTVMAGVDSKDTLVGMTSGPEIQACTIANMLGSNFLIPSDTRSEVLFALAAALWGGALGSLLSLRPALAGTCLSALGLVGLNRWALGQGFVSGRLLPLASPTLGLVLGSVLALAVQLTLTAQLRRRQSLAVVRELCPVHDLETVIRGQGLEVLLSDAAHNLTLLYLDLGGYAALCAQHDSVTVANTLRDYFESVRQVYHHFGGLVLDYPRSGGQQLVVFGLLPPSRSNQALAACCAAAALAAEHRSRGERTGPTVHLPPTRAGLESGPVRLKLKDKHHIATGDPVATAYRLQRLASSQVPSVVLGEATWVAAQQERSAQTADTLKSSQGARPRSDAGSPVKAQTAPDQTIPAQAAPDQTIPARVSPIQVETPYQNIQAQAAPDQTIPARVSPIQVETPYQTIQAQAAPDQTIQAKVAPIQVETPASLPQAELDQTIQAQVSPIQVETPAGPPQANPDRTIPASVTPVQVETPASRGPERQSAASAGTRRATGSARTSSVVPPALVLASVQVGPGAFSLDLDQMIDSFPLDAQGQLPWATKGALTKLASELDVGDSVAHYRLDAFLGEGGMGRVFKAQDLRLDRCVAFKVITGSLDEVTRGRFEKEAKTVAKSENEGIVRLYDVCVEEGQIPYLAMEFVPGQDLFHLIGSARVRGGSTSLAPAQAVDFTLQVLDALAVVHRMDIVHRDLKPSNLMLTPPNPQSLRRYPNGQIKVMDFGLARFVEEEVRLTKAGEVWGTPQYMSPEHLDADFGEVDALSDLFAVAGIFYELLTGSPPVTGTTVSLVLYDVLHNDPAPPHQLNPAVSERLSKACLKGLAKRKADRYPNAEEFASALRALL